MSHPPKASQKKESGEHTYDIVCYTCGQCDNTDRRIQQLQLRQDHGRVPGMPALRKNCN